MKFFNWMQSKINGGKVDKRTNSIPTTNHTKKDPPKEEFNDWPHGLLAIGTFGNTNTPLEESKQEIQANSDNSQICQEVQCPSPDLSEFTNEELGKLQKELTKLLSRKPDKEQPSIADLPLDRFLNCPSSLEVDRTSSNRFSSYSEDIDEEEIDRTIRIILGRCKDVCEKKKKKALGMKSLTFLVKKMFACRSGFAPAPSIRDTLQESRMEKLMRVMLTRKMNPQRSSSIKRYIEDCRPKSEADEEQESRGEGSKWDKTDSEFIVLEI